MESGIPLEKSGISLTIGIQNRSSSDKDWNPVPGIRNPRRGFQNPRLSWIPSLRRRRNLTPVSYVCKAALKSLFWAPNGLNELPEVRLEFAFNLIGKSRMAFLTG